MKAWKVLVLLAGAFGIYGFFQPFYHYTDRDVRAHVSGYRVVKGIDSPADIVEDLDNLPAREREIVDEVNAKVNGKLGRFGGVVVALYVPAGALALLGLIGVIRRGFGRLFGGFSLALGVVSLGIWGLFFAAAEVATHEAKGAFFSGGIGLHALLVAGLGGLIGGIGALIKPDRSAW